MAVAAYIDSHWPPHRELSPPRTPKPVVLPPTQDEPTKAREVGLGFEVVRRSEGQTTICICSSIWWVTNGSARCSKR